MGILEDLKEYKRLKTMLASEYKVTQKIIQAAIEEIAKYVLSKEDKIITSAEIITLASQENSQLSNLFSMDKTQQEKEIEADELIEMAQIFLSSNKLYKFTKI